MKDTMKSDLRSKLSLPSREDTMVSNNPKGGSKDKGLTYKLKMWEIFNKEIFRVYQIKTNSEFKHFDEEKYEQLNSV